MCLVLVNNHVFKLRNNSLALVAKGEGSTFVGTIIKAPEASRRRFPIGTRVIFKNDMGHVLCEGSAHDEQDKCLLHELDAVNYQGTDVRFKDLIERAKKKVKGRVILTVSAGEDQVGEKAEGEAPKKDEPKEVVAGKMMKYADLKPGQKFRHLHVRGLFQKTDVPAGQLGETVMVDPEGDLYRSKGQKFRTWPTDDVIPVTDAVEKKEEVKEVTAGKVMKFKDLKAGQKFKHATAPGIFKRTKMELIGDGFLQLGVTQVVDKTGTSFRVGEELWTRAEDDVILVA